MKIQKQYVSCAFMTVTVNLMAADTFVAELDFFLWAGGGGIPQDVGHTFLS